MVLAVNRTACQNISPYLIDSDNVAVKPLAFPIFGQKSMMFGSNLVDGMNLVVYDIKDVPSECLPYIRRLINGRNFLYNIECWCLYLRNAPKSILEHPFIRFRLEACRQFRLHSSKKSTRKWAGKPHLFIEERMFKRRLFIPHTFSSVKSNVIVSYIDDNDVATTGFIVPEASLYDFGILSSAMHMAWVRITCGKSSFDCRYSNTLCWNTFPLNVPSASSRRKIELAAKRILDERAKHSECLANLYSIDKMPDNLKAAHMRLDEAVDTAYCIDGFNSDRKRLECLFRMYEEKTRHNPVDIDQWC